MVSKEGRARQREQANACETARVGKQLNVRQKSINIIEVQHTKGVKDARETLQNAKMKKLQNQSGITLCISFKTQSKHCIALHRRNAIHKKCPDALPFACLPLFYPYARLPVCLVDCMFSAPAAIVTM
jgi:hypothetical protein